MIGQEDLCNELFVRGIDRTAPASQLSALPFMAWNYLVLGKLPSSSDSTT